MSASSSISRKRLTTFLPSYHEFGDTNFTHRQLLLRVEAPIEIQECHLSLAAREHREASTFCVKRTLEAPPSREFFFRDEVPVGHQLWRNSITNPGEIHLQPRFNF
jgi:hypothetical protein